MKNKIKKLMNRALRKEEGFTLVEIIVVIVIMAILAAIAVPSVLSYISDANDAKYIAEARSIYLSCQVEEAKENASVGNLTVDNYLHATGTNVIAKAVGDAMEDDTGILVKTITYTKASGTGESAVEESYVIEFVASDDLGVSATILPNGDITIDTSGSTDITKKETLSS